MQAKLIISFESYSEPTFLVKVTGISTGLQNNTGFPVPWPAAVPDPTAIAKAVDDYAVLYEEAKNGDRAKIKIRQDARVALTAKLKKVAAYLELVANGDVSLLTSTGFDLRHDSVKSMNTDPLGPLKGLKVTRGVLGGTLNVHATAQPDADIYNLEIASADPAVEANWSDAGDRTHCNDITLTGLTPGKTYYVRIRGFNKNGHGVWTTSAGIVVL